MHAHQTRASAPPSMAAAGFDTGPASGASTSGASTSGASSAPTPAPGSIQLGEVFRDRTFFFIGATGFVGKIYLFLLLRRHIDVEKVYCLIRPKPGKDANERLRTEVLTSPAFDPLREIMGKEAFEWIAMSKLEAVEGDIGLPGLGIEPQTFAKLCGKVDVLVNSSGLVDFNPPLEEALFVNAIGIRNVVDAAEAWDCPLLHVSTCYVAGNRGGTVFEDPEVQGFFPYHKDMQGVTFDPQRELIEGQQLADMVREEARHQEQLSAFTHEARKQLQNEARNPDDPDALQKAVKRLQDKWIDRRLMEYGQKRAGFYGWTNIYTYSKSLGEQVVAKAKVPFAIVRPSVVESSVRFPFPGWNEGFNTTAPLAYVALQGHVNLAANRAVSLDIIPVDLVASGMLAVTAALIQRINKRVYHLASGDINPCSMYRIVELVGLWKRRHYLERGRGNPLLNELYARVESVPVPKSTYERASSPMFGRLAGVVADAAEQLGGGQKRGLLGLATKAGTSARTLQKQEANINRLMEIFYPFTVDNNYRFRCEHIRELYSWLAPEDQASMPWNPDAIDWMHYWLDVHSRGLEKWVFPRIKDKLQRNPLPKVYTYQDLLELLDAATTNHDEDVAMRMLQSSGAEEVYTYAEVREHAARAAAFLIQHGVGINDRVLLVSENRPQWGMLYFGILQAKAVVVPVDAKATPRELANLAKASDAKAVIVSDKIWETSEDALLAVMPESIPFFTLGRVLQAHARSLPTLEAGKAKDALATLLFTSGTTGTPKGVMLSHQNFVSLVSAMAKVFRLGPKDRMLSVLPLHHTFEFSTGFLLPFSRGTQIIYLEELTGELIQEALKRHRVTAMVGVPALWELLHRKITSGAAEKGAAIEGLFMIMGWVNRQVRERTGLNLGRILFGPVHRFFGGRIRYLISGAAALPGEVQRGFDGFGLTLYEGYGLSEASPVLTVNRPGRRPLAGSVGTALPGVEVKIHAPDTSGVGEIIARGPNVMQGYFNEPGMSAEVLQDGWLHTGDLGRIDSAGRLFILGRKKEIIVDASGKNIYPDEVEELYSGSALIKELSVVGVPDGRGSEQVACLVVPESGSEGALLEDVRARIEEHFRTVSLPLPYHQRIKVLRFTDQLLPRTTTRKIKRKDVVRLLEAILKSEEVQSTTSVQAGPGSDAWLIDIVAKVTGRKVADIQPSTRFSEDLSMDSLMASELLVALESRSGGVLEVQDLLDVGTIEGLAQRLRDRASTYTVRPVAKSRGGRLRDKPWKVDLKKLHEVSVPGTVQESVKWMLGKAQSSLYGDLFDVVVKGRAFIPANRNVLVISNHSSHLDMGAVKTALGGYGDKLVTLAAADYFFAEGPRRFYFENFTNAVPLDRINPSREDIRRAQQLLEEGHNLLLFPEGTRSRSGDLQPFKRGVGMMALRFQVDVLPVFIKGAHEAMPRGAMFPRRRRLEVRIGAPVPYRSLAELTQEMPSIQAQTLVTTVLQKAVESLRDGTAFDLEQAGKEGPSRSTLELLMDELRERFDASRVETPVTFYFTFGPEEGDKWTVAASREVVEIRKGKPDQPADCVLKTSVSMFTRIVREGYVPAVSEFMDGTVKTNDPSRLQTLKTIFDL